MDLSPTELRDVGTWSQAFTAPMNVCGWCGREFLLSLLPQHSRMCALRHMLGGKRPKIPAVPPPRRRKAADQEPRDLGPWLSRWTRWYARLIEERVRQATAREHWRKHQLLVALWCWRRAARILKQMKTMIERLLRRMLVLAWNTWREWWRELLLQRVRIRRAIKCWNDRLLRQKWKHWRGRVGVELDEPLIEIAAEPPKLGQAPVACKRAKYPPPKPGAPRAVRVACKLCNTSWYRTQEKQAKYAREQMLLAFWRKWRHWHFPFRIRRWKEQAAPVDGRRPFVLGAWKDHRNFRSKHFR
eukprot:TRINITY_DN20446_c0_g1_i2.p1 TRINITY_DN20446_c0_g1~~TRINITY_DN20446_c0_g1_i2.p1  ORF type:complete len:300 (-),score=21.13 TRINITY_DN20446_c0_g1_i2:116-1015(-)